MPLRDFEMLAELRFSPYERRALMALMFQGVADAETLCREGEIPTSKIYLALEKLGKLGLVEMQPTRPKLYSALSTDAIFARLVEMAKEKADRFAAEAQKLKENLAASPRAAGRTTFVDLALGRESHVTRHLVHLATAKRRILSYMEQGDLAAIDQSRSSGAPVLRRIARNVVERKVDQRVVFGFGYRTAPKLVAFLKKHRSNLEHVTGVRYSGEFGHPFHVIDDDVVILCVDHPFVPEGRVASLMVRDTSLAARLADGFETLWAKAMRDLREISFQPG
ncbi:MAG: Transcriptional regulator, TrmB family [Bryobacterales bacterium]|nr:Transcriptional regulator, TrmB family [Bryobacterales bacterium]